MKYEVHMALTGFLSQCVCTSGVGAAHAGDIDTFGNAALGLDAGGNRWRDGTDLQAAAATYIASSARAAAWPNILAMVLEPDSAGTPATQTKGSGVLGARQMGRRASHTPLGRHATRRRVVLRQE